MAVAVGFDAYAVPKKGGYKLVWEDNFDGAALNRDYWNVEVNGSGCGNNELQYLSTMLTTWLCATEISSSQPVVRTTTDTRLLPDASTPVERWGLHTE